MSKIFTRTFRARYSEIGANGQVEPAHYLHYLVETAWDWSAANHLDIETSHVLGLVWIIRETELTFFRPLLYNDVFDFTIWMVEWRRVRGMRSFEMRLKGDGELIARGTQQAVSLDMKTMRPVTPPEEYLERFRLEEPQVLPSQPFPKASPDGIEPFCACRTVEWRDMDELKHVHNATYLEYAHEAVLGYLAQKGWTPDRMNGLTLQRLHIKYLSPAVWGNELDIRVYPRNQSARDDYFVSIKTASNGERICEAVLEYRH